MVHAGNGLIPLWYQAITWINNDILSIGPLETNLLNFYKNLNTFIQENALENLVYKMSAILLKPQSINLPPQHPHRKQRGPMESDHYGPCGPV